MEFNEKMFSIESDSDTYPDFNSIKKKLSLELGHLEEIDLLTGFILRSRDPNDSYSLEHTFSKLFETVSTEDVLLQNSDDNDCIPIISDYPDSKDEIPVHETCTDNDNVPSTPQDLSNLTLDIIDLSTRNIDTSFDVECENSNDNDDIPIISDYPDDNDDIPVLETCTNDDNVTSMTQDLSNLTLCIDDLSTRNIDTSIDDECEIPSLTFDIGNRVHLINGSGTLQRFIHKTRRWRIKTDDGKFERFSEKQLEFFHHSEIMSNNRDHTKMKDYQPVTEEELIKLTEEELNSSCYIMVIKQILDILKDDVFFDFSIFYDIIVSNRLEDYAFDCLPEMDVNVIDQVLSIYDLQLRYLCSRKTGIDKLKDELLGIYERPFYLALLCDEEHYTFLGKMGSEFFLYDPEYEFPIPCHYNEVIDYIQQDHVHFFWIQDIDPEYNCSWYIPEDYTISGSGKRKRHLPSDSSEDDLDFVVKETNRSKRSKRRNNKQKDKQTKPPKRKRTDISHLSPESRKRYKKDQERKKKQTKV